MSTVALVALVDHVPPATPSVSVISLYHMHTLNVAPPIAAGKTVTVNTSVVVQCKDDGSV
jgi:hypothetical protein